MGSATPDGAEASSFDLLDRWLAHHERPGRAMIEDPATAALPALTESSRQPDPAESPPSPEDGREADARGVTGAALPAAPVSAPAPRSAPDAVDLGVEHGRRTVAAFLLFASAVVTLLAASVAYADPGGVTVGLALVLVAATLTAWRARTRHPRTTVVATGSRLEIVRDGSRHVFDLADTRSPIDVIGLPGHRGWRVLFYRRGMSPFVLDDSTADAEAFMRVLHAHRSEVHYRPR